ncbi:MAG: hypothetical protein VKL60_15830 [Sphaerospermopsis sp.]|nr:hypothetical protein [Sphaerospermopsis sp.]
MSNQNIKPDLVQDISSNEQELLSGGHWGGWGGGPCWGRAGWGGPGWGGPGWGGWRGGPGWGYWGRPWHKGHHHHRQWW